MSGGRPRIVAMAAVTGVAMAACGFPDDWEFVDGPAGTSASSTTSGSGTAGGSGPSSSSNATVGSGGAAGTGGSGGCAPGFADCDQQPGCETNTDTDPAHCGGCNAPPCDELCVGGICAVACPPDSYEPNDAIQAPVAPPMPSGMQVFDTSDNVFKLTQARTATVSPTFTTPQDADTFHLLVEDDLPPPSMNTATGVIFEVTLSGVPQGATYSIASYYFCNDGGIQYFFHPSNTFNCAPGQPGAAFDGPWWSCRWFVPAPSTFWVHGFGCQSGKHDGVYQVEVTTVGATTCAPYVLSVKVIGVEVPI